MESPFARDLQRLAMAAPFIQNPMVTGPTTAARRRHPHGWRRDDMHTETQDAMRTALRQAGAITSVDGPYSIRERLHLAHRLYDAMLLLDPEERARRIRLIDAVFPPLASRL